MEDVTVTKGVLPNSPTGNDANARSEASSGTTTGGETGFRSDRGFVALNWRPSALAANYRVAWKPKDSPAGSAYERIAAETHAFLQELPIGVALVIAISARNRSGETTPTEIEITI